MLDPVLLCVYCPEQLHWLTRSDVFVGPVVRKLLALFNMLPVYRERDRIRVPDWSRRNELTFEACQKILRQNGAIAMFPEGSHRGMKQLHLPLKKGVARLALSAAHSGVSLEHFSIVPVGLDYSRFFSPRGTLLIRIGQPILVRKFIEMYPSGDARAGQAIMSSVHESLTEQMVDVTDSRHYEAIAGLQDLCDQISEAETLNGRLDYYRRILHHLNSTSDQEELQRIDEYIERRKYLALDERGVQHRHQTAFKWILQYVALAIGWLPSAAASVAFYPISALTEWFVAYKLKDPLFKNSIRLSFWTFLAPVWIAALALSVFIITNSATGATIVLFFLPFFGIIALFWYDLLDKVRSIRRAADYEKRQVSEFVLWVKSRNELIRMIRLWHERSK